jgi:hypothetical protein
VDGWHENLRITLLDGRRFSASPAHPTAGGALLGELQVGQVIDGSRISSIERLPAFGGVTYDLLPGGPSGTYWADGVELGSTLSR